VRAEAQDGGGTNNANFMTPGDGARPRMQMYLWDEVYYEVFEATPVSAGFKSERAAFGPAPLLAPQPDVSIVLVEDGTGNSEGCNPLTNGAQMSGNVALIDRGSCAFVDKVQNAEAVGAVAVVMMNSNPGQGRIVMGGDCPTCSIPAVMISYEDGQLLRADVPGASGRVERQSTPPPMLDGDLDAGIVSHEFGHGLSNRLVGGPLNVGCLNNCEQMGEGWSDLMGLIFTMAPGDQGSDGRGIGTFALGQDPPNAGIRTYRYSTDQTISLYDHADLTGFSCGSPYPGGEVWCSICWEFVWAFTDKYGYDPDLISGSGGNRQALHWLVEGMKNTPCGPTFCGARDGILQAIPECDGNLGAGDPRSEDCCLAWVAFAKRGLGSDASCGSSALMTDNRAGYDVPAECAANCGNGIPEAGEDCDDANSDPTDLCHDCMWTYCGDGWTQTPNGTGAGGPLNDGMEECDDGNAIPGDGCENDCTITAAAADVVLESCSYSDLCVSSTESDGKLDPGELATLTLRFRNQGVGASGNFQADVSVPAGGNLLTGGSVGAVDIPAGGFHDHVVEVDVTALCGEMLDVDVLDMRDDTGSYGDDPLSCDFGVGATVPGSIETFETTEGRPIPEDPASGYLWSAMDVPEPLPVNAVSVEIPVSHPASGEVVALLFGPLGASLDVSAAVNSSVDVTAFYGVQGPGQWYLRLSDSFNNGVNGDLVSWSLVIDVPERVGCNPCTAEVCTLPSFTAQAEPLTLCPGDYAVFDAVVSDPGGGIFTYEWDFGDGDFSGIVTDPGLAVAHRYDDPGSYAAVLTATWTRDPLCTTDDSVGIQVQVGVPPTGTVGNDLRALKLDRTDVGLSWQGASVNPPRYSLHKTEQAQELLEVPGGIDDEPVLAMTPELEVVDQLAVMTPIELVFYKVMPADSCGQTVLP
jgi:cysteine-rich repeat protein